MSPEGWTELMAKVQKPAVIICPTQGCGHKTKPHCDAKACLWFCCTVCDCTTWISPKFDHGPLGKKIVRWNIRRSVRLPVVK